MSPIPQPSKQPAFPNTEQHGSRIWFENTKSAHRHGGVGWEFGTCLWSPSKDKGGKDWYKAMRDVRAGDVVLNVCDKELHGASIAKGNFEERKDEPPEPGDWSGMAPYYRVDLETFIPLANPLPIDDLLKQQKEPITRELESLKTNRTADDYSRPPFQFFDKARTRLGLAQTYLTQCTPALYTIIRQWAHGNAGQSPVPPYRAVVIPSPQERDVAPQSPKSTLFTKADALKDLFITEANLDVILARLRRKQALILQGPPGVGKTFIAHRLAFTLMGERDQRRVKMVQFHPSYGYEDFVQGYRPTRAGLERRDGVFYEFARMARNDPDRQWFFIIDEINRGNLAKVFGELLVLLEADKRGPEHAIPLTYSEKDETFDFPANVHVIGTMNTADRSLAMVDYALRRRFAFVTLHPAFDSPAFVASLVERGASGELVAQIRTRVTAVNELIEKERDLGAGFRIGHSFFCPPKNQIPDAAWYRDVIESEIQPLLEEYFDSRDRVKDLVSDLLV